MSAHATPLQHAQRLRSPILAAALAGLIAAVLLTLSAHLRNAAELRLSRATTAHAAARQQHADALAQQHDARLAVAEYARLQRHGLQASAAAPATMLKAAHDALDVDTGKPAPSDAAGFVATPLHIHGAPAHEGHFVDTLAQLQRPPAGLLVATRCTLSRQTATVDIDCHLARLALAPAPPQSGRDTVQGDTPASPPRANLNWID